MKTKNQKRKENLEIFRQNLLPKIKKYYKVEEHGPKNAPATMYKIIITGSKNYDYYPMAEKLRMNTGDTYKWHNVTIDEMSRQIDILS